MESLDAIDSVYFITEHWFLCRVRHSRAVKESGWVQTDSGSNTCLLVQFHLASGYNSPAEDTWQYVTRVVTLGSAWRFSRTINSSVRQSTTLRDVSWDLYSHFLAVSSLFAVFFCHCWQDIFRSGSRPRSLSKYHSRRV